MDLQRALEIIAEDYVEESEQAEAIQMLLGVLRGLREEVDALKLQRGSYPSLM